MARAKINPGYAEDIQSETTDYDRKRRRRVTIDVADMQIALTDFKSNVIRRHFLTPFLGLVGLWLPIVSKSEFKNFLEIESNKVEGVYTGIAIAITAYVLFGWVTPIKKVWPFSKISKPKAVETTSSPKDLANILHEEGVYK